ncbi:MAG: signal peptidase I [Armatimonadetes bacterium]|nr:signal peptidase I [Armatimonadota bacterium]
MEFLLAQSTGGPSDGVSIIDTLARTPLSKVFIFVAVCTVLRLALAPGLAKTPPHMRTGGYKARRFFNETLDAIVYAGVVVFMVIRPFGIQAFQIPSPSMVDTLLVNDFIVANKAVYRYTHPQCKDIVVFRPPAYACSQSQLDTDGQPKVDFIKRCIGVPGDVVEIRGGVLYRNGKAFEEPFRKGSNEYDWKLVHYTGEYEPLKGQFVPVSLDATTGRGNFQIPGIAKKYAVGALPDPPAHADGEPWVLMWKNVDELNEQELRTAKELADAPPAAIPPGHYLMMGDNRGQSFDGRAWGLVTEEQIVGRSEIIWLPIKRWRTTR